MGSMQLMGTNADRRAPFALEEWTYLHGNPVYLNIESVEYLIKDLGLHQPLRAGEDC